MQAGIWMNIFEFRIPSFLIFLHVWVHVTLLLLRHGMSALLLASRKGMMEMDMTCVRFIKPYPPGKKQGTFKMVGKMGFPFFKGYVSSLEGKMASEIRWLEDKVSFWKGLLAGAMLVSESVSFWSLTWHLKISALLEDIFLGKQWFRGLMFNFAAACMRNSFQLDVFNQS